MICPNCQHKNRETARFCDNCGHKLDRGEKAVGSLSSSPASKFIPKALAAKLEAARAGQTMEGERRIVTMLFCDVKGSTAAAEQLDPEDWAEVMSGVFEHMIRPIYKYEGTVARLMGDAILAFFGAPIAHEDDPQRAVLAGLEIVSEIAPYRKQVAQQWDIDFDVRVGINTGLVMVGAVGSDLRMEYTAMGDATNLAARMEQTAAPGTVQISQDTYQHVAPFFEFESLGGIQVKGKQDPVQTYQPLRRKGTPGKGRGIEGLAAPLIGRGKERSLLEETLADMEKGEGGIICLLGEAGLGKSRLIQEIKITALDHASPIIPTWRETFSYSYETEQPYGLFRRLLRGMIGALPEEDPARLRTKIQLLEERIPPGKRQAAQQVIETLLGLTVKDDAPPLEGETFKGLLYTTMTSLWQLSAHDNPVVLVCDDLHWSDPASLGLLQHLFPLINSVPLLFLCALRPDMDAPGWEVIQVAEREFSQRFRKIHLQPLNATESRALVDSLLDISDLPPILRDRIMEKSEGNPFFVEEVVRSLIDKDVLVRNEAGVRWQAAGEGEDLDIPGNLQTLLVARIDRLRERTRWTLQVASVVGRSFYHRVLQRIVDFTTEVLDQHLRSLQSTQLIQEAGRIPELEYLFRHALTQEAAYSTILLKQRRVFHRRVGEALEALFPDRIEEMAGTLAGHFFKAKAFEKSLQYSILAGDAAFRLYALREAIEHYGRAIQCTGKVDAGSEQLIHIYSRVGRAYEHDYQFQKALEAYLEMERLAEGKHDEQMKLASLIAQCILHATHNPVFDPTKARELGQSALILAQKLDDRVAEARALWGMMLVEFSAAGGFEQVIDYGHQSLSIARELGLKELIAFILGSLTWMYVIKGQLALAQQANKEAQAIWTTLGNLPMLADTFTLKLVIQWVTGQYDAGLETAGENYRLSRSIGNVWNQREAMRMMGVLHMLKGQFDRALERFDAIQVNPKDDVMPYQGFSHSWISLYLLTGAVDDANRYADELYTLSDAFMPLFASYYLAIIARVKFVRGEFQKTRELLDQAWERFNPEGPMSSLRSAIDVVEGLLNLVLGNPQPVVDRMEENVRSARETGFILGLPESLWLLGKARLALGERQQARAAFLEAKAEAEDTGERTVLWQIQADLGQLERSLGNIAEADKLRGQAQATIEYIADHSPPELRAKFLAQSEVRAIVDMDLP